MKPRGLFITLEGIDGTGKSTQLRRLVAYLRQRGYRVRATREPGGTRLGEQVRRALLDAGNSGLAPLAELALLYAARAQHLHEVVRPALARGDLVVSDRFNDASLAYQGFGRRLGLETVRTLDRLICGRTQPDLTLLLDVEPRVALARARRNRFEAEGIAFQKRVRAGYLAIARREPRRVKLVRAHRSPGEVESAIQKLVDPFLTRK